MKYLFVITLALYISLPFQTNASVHSGNKKILVHSAPPLGAMLKRACYYLKKGDIDSTRLILEHIATISKEAKYHFALASTHDTAYLAHFEILHPRTSLHEAIKWYTKAAELDHAGAKIRLKKIKKMTPKEFLTYSNQPSLKDLPKHPCSTE